MKKSVFSESVSVPGGKSGGMKKSVATTQTHMPEKEADGMRKSVAASAVSLPDKHIEGMKKSVLPRNDTQVVPYASDKDIGGMRKSVLSVDVPEPEDKAVEMNKAEIPVQGSSIQHIGGWKGMNKRATYDSGALSEATNVTFRDFPNVESVKVPETVKTFKFCMEYTIGEDGTVTYNDESIGKIYDCVTRGDEMFLACDKGYVWAKEIDGKLCYMIIGDCRASNLPTKKARLCFVETTDDETISATINKNVCVFNRKLTNDGTDYMPVFPSGSIDVVDNFMPLLWNGSGESDIDTSRIYCVCDEDGKADEVWKYFSKVPGYCERDSAYKVSCWVELRRNVFARWYSSEAEIRISYYKKGGNCNASSTYDSGYIGYKIEDVTSQSEAAAYDTGYIDAFLLKKGICADDDIAGSEYAGENYDHICGTKGIFNYETTVAPEFDHVTFYKGRVFGSVGSRVICSVYNNYNKWTLDTTDNISSENAWMTTTTANANADGDIVAMREYLGRISVLKSGFMQEVYGGSNPFTIQDVYAVGTVFPEAVCEAYGRLCFCGKNAVRTYGGSFPKVIGDELGVDIYEDVKMLGDDRNVLIKTGDDVYKYDFLLGMWESRESDLFEGVSKLILLSGEMYALTDAGEFIKMDGTSYGEWSFATDAMTENTLSLKRLQKVKITYELGAGSDFAVEVMKSDGTSEQVFVRTNEDEETILQRAEVSLTNVVDWFLKLRFAGEGYFKLVSLDLEVKNGGTAAYE